MLVALVVVLGMIAAFYIGTVSLLAALASGEVVLYGFGILALVSGMTVLVYMIKTAIDESRNS